MTAPAERAAFYLLEQTHRLVGRRARQGAWNPPLSSGESSPLLGQLARERIHRVPRQAVQALLSWAEGREVRLLQRVPEAREVLALQVRGARCVSLLPAGADTAPHASPLEFLVHDLCHLGKFLDPRHHTEQVGFFRILESALSDPRWQELEASFDDEWRRDRDHVLSDMNGSAVYLFAAFKMKLKMAVRRALPADAGSPRTHGPLDATELEAFDAVLERALRIFGFGGELAWAARTTSTRRDEQRAALILAGHFRELGDRPRND